MQSLTSSGLTGRVCGFGLFALLFVESKTQTYCERSMKSKTFTQFLKKICFTFRRNYLSIWVHSRRNMFTFFYRLKLAMSPPSSGATRWLLNKLLDGSVPISFSVFQIVQKLKRILSLLQNCNAFSKKSVKVTIKSKKIYF